MQVADTWKEGLARLVARRPFGRLMVWGMRLVIPRQRVGVALVAFNSREEVFLLRHVFHTVAPWGLPGGWLGRNEAPSAGVARELREETNLEVVVGPPCYVTHEPTPSHIAMAYLGWIRPGPVRLNGEIIEARWFDLDHLPQPLHPFTRQAIAAARPLARLHESPVGA